MSSAQESLMEKLRALEQVFIDKLPGKISEITQALEQVLEDTGNAEHLAVLHRYLHTMAGSAGTFGFSELGAQARAFETRLKPLMSGGHWPAGQWQTYAQEVSAYFAGALNNLDAQRDQDDSDVLALAPAEEKNTRRIFLVDEDAQQNQEIILQLEHFGYAVEHLSRLGNLATRMAQCRPDVLIIELSFAEGAQAGAEEVARLRQIEAFHVPTLYISRSSSFESRLMAVQSAGEGFFTKPVDVVALVERIDTLMHAHERKAYRVLIIDDDMVTAAFYQTILSDAGMEVKLLGDPSMLLNVMTEFRPELLLMDVYMPLCSGVELTRMIRQDNSYLDIPIVFLSSEADLGRQLAAVKAGADDFITKPIASEYLISALSTRAERYRSLRSLIMRDGLTGLYNHSATKEQLGAEISLAGRNRLPLALAMLDLDNFKMVNDTYGHPVGDQVLRTLARLLRQRLRRSDIIGRYGGEEFAVIFPDTDAKTAMQVLDQVRQAFCKIQQHSEQGPFSVSFSGGVAELEQANDLDQLIELADTALYASKQAGRNRVTLAESP